MSWLFCFVFSHARKWSHRKLMWTLGIQSWSHRFTSTDHSIEVGANNRPCLFPIPIWHGWSELTNIETFHIGENIFEQINQTDKHLKFQLYIIYLDGLTPPIHPWFLPKVKVTSLATVELAECLDRCAPNQQNLGVPCESSGVKPRRHFPYRNSHGFCHVRFRLWKFCSSHRHFCRCADQGQNAALEAAKDGRCAHLLEWFLGLFLVGISPGTRRFHTLAVAIQDFLLCASNLHQIYIIFACSAHAHLDTLRI